MFQKKNVKNTIIENTIWNSTTGIKIDWNNNISKKRKTSDWTLDREKISRTIRDNWTEFSLLGNEKLSGKIDIICDLLFYKVLHIDYWIRGWKKKIGRHLLLTYITFKEARSSSKQKIPPDLNLSESSFPSDHLGTMSNVWIFQSWIKVDFRIKSHAKSTNFQKLNHCQ